MGKNRITKERFTAVVEQTMGLLYWFSYGILRNKTDAEDAVAQCLLKAWEKLDQVKNEKQLRSWMIQIVKNTSKNMLSRRGREVSFTEEIAAGFIQEEPQETSLWSQVWELEEIYREVLLLYYYEGYSVKEIAGMLRVPQGTVKSRLARSRERLREILEKEDK